MNSEIASSLSPSADEWGIVITRTSITDIVIDDHKRGYGSDKC